MKLGYSVWVEGVDVLGNNIVGDGIIVGERFKRGSKEYVIKFNDDKLNDNIYGRNTYYNSISKKGDSIYRFFIKPKYIQEYVKDTRLARKLYPNAEKLDNGMLRIKER